MSPITMCMCVKLKEIVNISLTIDTDVMSKLSIFVMSDKRNGD